MQKKIKAKVTERGVLIPRKLLKGIKEVEIRPQNGLILIVPVHEKDPIFNIGKNPVKRGVREKDPIFSIGKNPVKSDVTDLSINHDKYIYDL